MSEQKLTWEKRTAVRMNLAAINEAITQLLDLLPEDQQHRGSECEIIASAVNALYYKYVAEGDWKPEGYDGK